MKNRRKGDKIEKQWKKPKKLWKVKMEYYMGYCSLPGILHIDATFPEDSGIFLEAHQITNWNHVVPYNPHWIKKKKWYKK